MLLKSHCNNKDCSKVNSNEVRDKNVTQTNSLFLHYWRYHKYVTQNIKQSISDGPENKKELPRSSH